MANPRTIDQIQAEIKANQESNNLIREKLKLLEQAAKAGKPLTDAEKEYVKYAKESLKIEQRRVDFVKKFNKELLITAQSLSDISDYQTSINQAYGKNSELAKAVNKQLEIAKNFQASIVAEIESGNIKTAAGKKKLAEISAAYGNMQVSIINADKALAAGEITLEERNKLVEKAASDYKDLAEGAKDIAGISQETLDAIEQTVVQTGSLAKAMKSAAVQSQLYKQAMQEVVAGAGPLGPVLDNINTLTKTNIRDTLAWKAAVFALGAALGKVAYDYFGAPIKAGMQADRERQQAEIDNIAAVAKLRKDAEFIPQQIQQERNEQAITAQNEVNRLMHEAQFAAQKAANSFSASMQQAAAQFNAASKTALFGNKLGGVGYGAAQLQMAGISADKIAEAMSTAAAATGKMPTGKAAADMAIMAERTGTSVDDIAQITEHFQRIDGMSANMSMNMAEGMRSMADQAGISLGNLMKEVAESSKEALGYQIKSGPALAKAVAYAQSMGVSFGDIAKAGKSMVMNYKDSIKAEMQLSSLLGEQVDLSEVRAKFAEGDTTGAMQALQAQGLDPAQMDMFQQEALSQALGGMDLQSLSKIATGTGKEVGGLKAGNAAAGNKGFLGAAVSAQAGLEAAQASISANQAVIDAKLSQQIADAYLASPEYENYKKAQNEAAIEAENLGHKMKDAWLQTDDYKKSLADSMKLDFASSIKESLMGGLSALAGGLGTTLIDKIIPKGGIGGKVAGMFGLGAGGGGGDEGGGGGDGGGGATDGPIASVAAQIQAAEPVIKKAKPLGKSLAEFGKGIGDFLKNVGKGFGGMIQEVFRGISKGLSFFNPAALKGATILAGIILVIGAAIAGASWLMGKALPTLAEGLMAFNDVDGKNLAAVGLGVTALGVGMAAMGAGTVIAGIGNLVGNLFGGGIEDTIKKVEKFSEANINAAKVKNNADAIVAYSKAMAASGLGSAASGLGNLVGGIANGIAKFFGVKPPLKQMEEFSRLNMGDTTKLKANAEAFTIFGNAMSSYQGGSGSLGGVLADGVAKFFGIEPPLEKMKKFATADLGDTSKLKSNAEAFTLFGNAMATYKGDKGGLMNVLAEGVAGFFNEETPLEKFKKFAAVSGINVEQVKNNAEAFTMFGNAMASYQGEGGEGFWSSLGKGISSFFGGGEEDLITKFQRFSALNSSGITATANAIGALNTSLGNYNATTATNVGTGLSAFATGVNNSDIGTAGASISSLTSYLNLFNQTMAETSTIATGMYTIADSFMVLARALTDLASVNVAALNELPWVRMTAFAGVGGGFVIATSAKNSMNISESSAKNIDAIAKDSKSSLKEIQDLNKNTRELVNLNKNIEALTKALFTKTDAQVVSLDGKRVSTVLNRYSEYTKAIQT